MAVLVEGRTTALSQTIGTEPRTAGSAHIRERRSPVQLRLALVVPIHLDHLNPGQKRQGGKDSARSPAAQKRMLPAHLAGQSLPRPPVKTACTDDDGTSARSTESTIRSATRMRHNALVYLANSRLNGDQFAHVPQIRPRGQQAPSRSAGTDHSCGTHCQLHRFAWQQFNEAIRRPCEQFSKGSR